MSDTRTSSPSRVQEVTAISAADRKRDRVPPFEDVCDAIDLLSKSGLQAVRTSQYHRLERVAQLSRRLCRALSGPITPSTALDAEQARECLVAELSLLWGCEDPLSDDRVEVPS